MLVVGENVLRRRFEAAPKAIAAVDKLRVPAHSADASCCEGGPGGGDHGGGGGGRCRRSWRESVLLGL
ncbi:hypothetical protein BDZ91DRAFT_742504 [Kalaharituber pfeilii]|nr:hypothetical protein BDZ91DRAFT_742504 [Kalaharituber pfeilii]